MSRGEGLYNAYSGSRYGQEMQTKTRFGVFQPESVGTDLWCEVLGDDVNNLWHMAHTALLAEQFASIQDLSTGDTDRLLTVAYTHDWGEAIVGDIPMPDKTDNDEVAERSAYAKIARELIGIPHSLALTAEVWSVLSHEDEEMGDRFKTIEYLGYCTTALRAHRMGINIATGVYPVDIERADKDRLVSGLMGLHTAVQVGNFGKLAEMGKRHKAVREIMRSEA